MAFGIAVVYKALREITYATYWRCVLVMTAQIVCGIAAIAFAIGIFVQFVIPHLNSP
jgi:ABC-type cobalamin transport system permease subunit